MCQQNLPKNAADSRASSGSGSWGNRRERRSREQSPRSACVCPLGMHPRPRRWASRSEGLFRKLPSPLSQRCGKSVPAFSLVDIRGRLSRLMVQKVSRRLGPVINRGSSHAEIQHTARPCWPERSGNTRRAVSIPRLQDQQGLAVLCRHSAGRREFSMSHATLPRRSVLSAAAALTRVEAKGGVA